MPDFDTYPGLTVWLEADSAPVNDPAPGFNVMPGDSGDIVWWQDKVAIPPSATYMYANGRSIGPWKLPGAKNGHHSAHWYAGLSSNRFLADPSRYAAGLEGTFTNTSVSPPESYDGRRIVSASEHTSFVVFKVEETANLSTINTGPFSGVSLWSALSIHPGGGTTAAFGTVGCKLRDDGDGPQIQVYCQDAELDEFAYAFGIKELRWSLEFETWYILEFWHQSGQLGGRINGGQLQCVPCGDVHEFDAIDAGGGVSVGSTGASGGFNGDIAEIAVWSQSPGAITRQEQRQTLADKYAIDVQSVSNECGAYVPSFFAVYG